MFVLYRGTRVSRPTLPITLTLTASILALAASSPSANAATAAESCKNAAAGDDQPFDLALNFELVGGQQYDTSSPSWTRTDRSLLGVALARRGSSRTLLVCTITAPRVQRTLSRSIRSEGPPIRIATGSTVVDVSVSNRWIAWATQGKARTRTVVHRRRIESSEASTVSRSFGGAVQEVVASPAGRVVVNTLTATTQHVWRWTPGTRPKRVIPQRRYFSNEKAPVQKQPLDLASWEPGTVALATENGPLDLVDVDGPRGCAPWDTKAKTTIDRRTSELRAVVDNSSGWSRRVVLGSSGWTNNPDDVETTEHLKICDARGKRLVGVKTGFYESGGDSYKRTVSVDIVGGVVVAPSSEYLGGGGGGDSAQGSTGSTPIFVTTGPPAAQPSGQPGAVVATHAGAAWVSNGEIWVSDAGGIRRTGIAATDGTPIRLEKSRLTVETTTGPSTFDLKPIPPARTTIATGRTVDSAGPCGRGFPDCPPTP